MDKSTFTKHYKAFREYLRSMREEAGLTQQEVADTLRVAQTTIARMEQGERRIDIVEFYWFCKALKVDPVKAATKVLRGCQALDRRKR